VLLAKEAASIDAVSGRRCQAAGIPDVRDVLRSAASA
jgi:hypothetical protein